MAKLNRSELDAVIQMYAPLVCFHPREKYRPCSVEWFLERATLCRSNGERRKASVSNLPTTAGGDKEYWLEYPA